MWRCREDLRAQTILWLSLCLGGNVNGLMLARINKPSSRQSVQHYNRSNSGSPTSLHIQPCRSMLFPTLSALSIRQGGGCPGDMIMESTLTLCSAHFLQLTQTAPTMPNGACLKKRVLLGRPASAARHVARRRRPRAKKTKPKSTACA